jgi:predicted amidohydrolase YtcJ
MSGHADLILANGAVHAMDAGRAVHEAVAVRGERIVAAGGAGAIAELAGPQTRTVDVEGGMVLPGFHDAHCHLAESGFDQTQCVLDDAGGAEGHLRRIAEYAADHPDREWILGGGWAMDDFPGGIATRELLDAIVPDRPVFLPNRDYHGAWVNTRALELAGIGADTPDPDGGRIERDAEGAPIGTLQEGAMGLVSSLAPEPTADQRAAGILAAQAFYHRLGITACQDALVSADVQRVYERLAGSGQLTLRVRANLGWQRDRDEGQLAELLERRRTGRIGRLDCGNVKFFHDGVVETRTAAMLDPYRDGQGRPTDDRGLDLYDREALARFIRICDAEGFGIHIHTIGDRAVRESLDALEAAGAANGARDARHQLAHVQFAHPDDVVRFGSLGVIANVTPLWARMEGYVRDLTLPFISEQAAAMIYPFASIARAGGRLAFGSDWSVSTPDPLHQLATAVSRRDPEVDGGEQLLPHEALDVGDALAAHTIGAAHAAFLDAETGSLEPGKLADIVVLDRDLTALPPEQMIEARVLLTVSQGATVYAAPGWA